MQTIVGIPGSLRELSFNAGLLRYAATVLPRGWELDVEPIGDIPLYDADVERLRGLPDPVRRLKERIREAEGLWLCTPEYNHGVPGVLKNTIDWLSRPPKDIPKVFGDKPVALSGVTPGKGGTRLSQAALLPTLATLGTRVFSGKSLHVASAAELFDAGANPTDEKLCERVKDFANAFIAFIEGTES